MIDSISLLLRGVSDFFHEFYTYRHTDHSKCIFYWDYYKINVLCFYFVSVSAVFRQLIQNSTTTCSVRSAVIWAQLTFHIFLSLLSHSLPLRPVQLDGSVSCFTLLPYFDLIISDWEYFYRWIINELWFDNRHKYASF